jgi:hypothetical protein
MKTENFDEAIRKKLEGINPKFTEQDIDKVYRYVAKNRGPFYRRMNGHGLMYTALVGAIAGLIVWNLIIRQKSHEPEKVIVQTRTIVPPASAPHAASIAKAENTTSGTHPQNKSISTVTGTGGSLTRQPSAETPEDQLSAQQVQLTTIPETVQTENPLLAETIQRKIETTGLPLLNARLAKEITATGTKTQTILNSGSRPSVITFAPEKTQQIAKTKPLKTKKNSNRYTSSSGNSSSSRILAKPTRPGNTFLSNTEPRLGAGLELNNGQKSAGIYAELLYGKNWGLAAGFKYTLSNGEDFRDETDFYNRKSRHFDQVFHGQPPMHDKISNIGIDNAILQIPITLTYYYPLKKGYTLSLGLGTDLDIYTSALIKFDSRHGADSLAQSNSIKTSEPVEILNNVVISLGLQKRWNRFTLQATPFISPQLKHVNYKKEDLYFGFGLKLYYSLSR